MAVKYAKHRNVGAPFKREGPGVEGMWGRHEIHEPTARELEMWHRKLEPVEDEADPMDQYATGGGWYRLPSGNAVQGREQAVRALRAEQADEAEEADTSTTSEETP